MRSVLARAAAAGVLTCLLGADAAGAQGAGDPVPRELVLALVNAYRSDDTRNLELLVGRAPDNLPGELTPRGPRVVGSMVYPARRSSTVILALAAEPTAALLAIERPLVQRGWEPPRGRRPGRGGFVERDAAAERGVVLCKDQAWVHVSAHRTAEDSSIIRVQHSTARRREQSPCERPEMRQARWQNVPVPSLVAPRRAEVEPGGQSGSGEVWDTRARVRSSQSATALAEHFDAQLREDGWMPVSSAIGTGIAVRTYRQTDERGRRWYGELLVSEIPDTDSRSLVFRLTDLDASS